MQTEQQRDEDTEEGFLFDRLRQRSGAVENFAEVDASDEFVHDMMMKKLDRKVAETEDNILDARARKQQLFEVEKALMRSNQVGFKEDVNMFQG